MEEVIEAIVLGIIEGITEFLPISSTGHLLIAQHWLGPRSDLFNIAIQVGAILGVVVVYWQRLLDLSLRFRQPENRDYLYKLMAAFAITARRRPLCPSLPAWSCPRPWRPSRSLSSWAASRFWPSSAGWHRRPPNERVTWLVVVCVGLSQVVAGVFPGTSRSAAAIFAAMLAGLTSRPAAAEFAFLVGIPTMIAAAGYELVSMLGEQGVDGENWSSLAIAFVAAAIVAFASVKWLLIYIRAHRFTPFAWYRIIFGVVLLAAVR